MKRALLVVGVMSLLWANQAEASTITFSYAGEVVSVGALDPENPFPTEPVFGTPFSGTYTFNSLAADGVLADTTTGAYHSAGAAFGLTLDIGGLSFSYGAVDIGVTNGYSSYGFGSDQYLVGYTGGATLLSMRFTDFTAALFSSDLQPLLPPALGGLFTEFFFASTIAGNQVDLNGTITSLACTSGCTPADPQPVPEPATLSLVAGALGILGARRRMRRGR